MRSVYDRQAGRGAHWVLRMPFHVHKLIATAIVSPPQVPSKQPFVFLDFYTKMTLLGPVRQKQDKHTNNTGSPYPVSLGLITTCLRCPFRWLKMRSLMVNLNNRQCQLHHLRRAPNPSAVPLRQRICLLAQQDYKSLGPGDPKAGLVTTGSFWEPAVSVNY